MNKKLKKPILLVVFTLVLINVVITGAVAYIKLVYSKENEFTLGTVTPKIIEKYDATNNTRKDIHIKNDGNFPIYVRVSDIYYFENKNQELVTDVPTTDVDYSIIFSSSNNWIKLSDGFYYYRLMLDPGDVTDNLIDKCTTITKTDEKTFKLDIVVESLQAFPTAAIEEAWGVTVEENMISAIE